MRDGLGTYSLSEAALLILEEREGSAVSGLLALFPRSLPTQSAGRFRLHLDNRCFTARAEAVEWEGEEDDTTTCIEERVRTAPVSCQLAGRSKTRTPASPDSLRFPGNFRYKSALRHEKASSPNTNGERPPARERQQIDEDGRSGTEGESVRVPYKEDDESLLDGVDIGFIVVEVSTVPGLEVLVLEL